MDIIAHEPNRRNAPRRAERTWRGTWQATPEDAKALRARQSAALRKCGALVVWSLIEVHAGGDRYRPEIGYQIRAAEQRP